MDLLQPNPQETLLKQKSDDDIGTESRNKQVKEGIYKKMRENHALRVC